MANGHLRQVMSARMAHQARTDRSRPIATPGCRSHDRVPNASVEREAEKNVTEERGHRHAEPVPG